MDKAHKKQLRLQIQDLLDKCETCEIKAKHYQKQYESGIADNNSFNRYCNTECNVGKQLKTLGNQLEKGEIKLDITKDTFTKEVYEKLSKSMKDVEIEKKYGLDRNLITRRKKEWGLTKQYKKEKKEKVFKPNPVEVDWKKQYQESQIKVIDLAKRVSELNEVIKEKDNRIEDLAEQIVQLDNHIFELQNQEEDLGFEEVKDERDMYKEKYEKVVAALKVVL